MTTNQMRRRAADEFAPRGLGQHRLTEPADADRWATEMRQRTADENATWRQRRAEPRETGR